MKYFQNKNLLTIFLFILLISGIVFTLPNGLFQCTKEINENYCAEGNPGLFFVMPWFWPIGFLVTTIIGMPVLYFFQIFSEILSLGWEIPIASQPYNERNAILPVVAWVLLLLAYFIYAKIIVTVLHLIIGKIKKF